MTKTRSDLVHRALKNLGALPQGLTPDAQEYNAIDELIDPMVEDLVARDVAFIEDVDAIEDRYFIALGHVLAGIAAPEFGLQSDAAIASYAQKGEQDLRVIAAARPTFDVLEIQAY